MNNQIPSNPASPVKKRTSVRLEDEPVVTTPPTGGPLNADLSQKMTEKIEQEVTEAIGDVARRKEYRDSLAKAGVSMDWLVENLKNIAMGGEKDSDRIKALQVIAKSLGVDKAGSKDEEAGGSWEEEMLKVDVNAEEELSDYAVNEPVVPEKAQKKRVEDNKTKSIYDN